VLTDQYERQGHPAPDTLVFPSAAGTELDRHNVLRAFRLVVRNAGMQPGDWTPRELRHSFVSLLSDSGVSISDVADLCGHSGTTITESVYRHQLRPVLLHGAIAMDAIFTPKPSPGA
jgi:integrase